MSRSTGAVVAAFARPETSIATLLWAVMVPVPVKVSAWSWPTPFSTEGRS